MTDRESVWLPIETEPDNGKPVLIYYTNSNGHGRTIKAFYAKKFAVEWNGSTDFDDDFYEYDEATDNYYWPEGWHEMIDNWPDYSSVMVHEGKPTHWMTLPAPPTQRGNDAGE